ncbi:MAG: nucleotidyltransferase domain-containing protein [Nitrospirae bacterium]|nr:nucleotidyltransferase domain-containing protein [Nitrospirota bacterium]
MPLDIRPDHMEIVRNILENVIPEREVWAFGSRVNGTARKTSDLDLVVIGVHPLEFQTLGRLLDAFSASDLPYKVDVVDWSRTGEGFRTIIVSNHVVLQKPRRQSQ